MTERKKTTKQYVKENKELRNRLKDAKHTLEAISKGEVDALVISDPRGERVYVLNGADYPYRVLIETMNEGAVTVTADGTNVYCNDSLLSLLKIRLKKFRGSQLRTFVATPDLQVFDKLIKKGLRGSCRGEVDLKTTDGTLIPVLLSCKSLSLDKVQCVSKIVTDISDRKRAEETVRKTLDELEIRVRERTKELQIETQKLEETNIALKVLLKRKGEDQAELEERILLNVEELVIPYLEKLKKNCLDDKQEVYLSILESNLREIISPFSRK